MDTMHGQPDTKLTNPPPALKPSIDTFLTLTKNQGSIFGGAPNWFFTGPSGERIELMGRV